MRLTKIFVKELLQEACQLFNDNIYPIDNVIEVEFIDKRVFLEDAKKNHLIKQQIQLGIYNDFDKEYPNFFVVYASNKDPMRRVLGLPYKVTVCFDIAKDCMKRFSSSQVKEYFKYAFIHELGHIYEDKIIAMYPEKWEYSLENTKGMYDLAKELLVDDLANELCSTNMFDSINEELWEPVKRRDMKLLAKRR